MKVSRKAMKEIMKSDTGSFRKKMDRVVEWSSTYFAKEYWSKMTESKDVRNLDFEAKVIRILDLNSIDKWEDKQKAIHTCVSFSGAREGIEFFEKKFTKSLQKEYHELHIECNSSSIKVLDEEKNILFKAKCSTSFSNVYDQLTLKINIDSAKFTYGDYFKEKELENDAELEEEL